MGKQHKTTDTPPTTGESTEEEIRTLAYHLYCQGGYQDGRALEYWLEAERQVQARRKSPLRKVA